MYRMIVAILNTSKVAVVDKYQCKYWHIRILSCFYAFGYKSFYFFVNEGQKLFSLRIDHSGQYNYDNNYQIFKVNN